MALAQFALKDQNTRNAYVIAYLTGNKEAMRALEIELDERYSMVFGVAFSLFDMMRDEVMAVVDSDDYVLQGYYVGRITFEVVGIFFSVGKAGKLDEIAELSQSDILLKFGDRIDNADFHDAKLAAIAQGMKPRAAAEAAELLTTKMCFVAGTLVHTEQGLVPIEDIRPDMRVLARDPETGEIAYKPVLDTFTTRPERLYHITIRSGGEGDGDEEFTLICTGEHPFFVEDVSGFVPAEELVPGDELFFASGQTGHVAAIALESAPEGEPFTTYNFEVADFHTYFVGKSGVWVHNAGHLPCEKVFFTFVAVARKLGLSGNALKAKRFEILVETKQLLKEGVDSRVWGRSAADVSQKMLNDYAAGSIQLSDLPSVAVWRTQFFKRNTTGADVDIHHAVEEYIQRLLGIDPDSSIGGIRIGDSCPGIPLPRNKAILDALNKGKSDIHKLKSIHRGKGDGGISGVLQSRIKKGNPEGLSQQEILDELRAIYDEIPDAENQWPAARGWLLEMQVKGAMPPHLNIPD